MKKGKKIGLGIAVGLIVVVGAVTIWQWSNIKAIYMGVRYNEEKIETKITETKEKLAEKLEKEGVVDKKIIEGFSKEDEEKLAKGEMTVEEAVDKLFAADDEGGTADEVLTDSNDSVDNSSTTEENVNSENNPNSVETQQPENDAKSTENSEKKNNNEKKTEVNEENKVAEQNNKTEVNASSAASESSSTSEAKALIETAVREMYTLKATYVQQLASIESAAKKLFYQGEITNERKLQIADTFMPQLVDAERSCDAQVESILTNLKNGLNAIGADASVVEDIRAQYQNEKQLQKSKYISKYM